MEQSKDQGTKKDKDENKLERNLKSDENHCNNLDIEQGLVDEQHKEQQLITEEKDTELINSLTEQIELIQDKLLRAVAESENTRHRMNKKVEEAKDYAIVSFAKDLVPVIDNFSMALSHVPENLDDSAKIIVEGVKMTRDELLSVFKKHGIESIEPQEGDNFDYNNHYAISQVVTDQHKDGTIISTMQVGYKIKDRLIRPASVAVAKNN
jgi:molecular chaperone GrpE